MSYILLYNGGMDITAYWLNHKKRDAGDGKVYYFYPYTRCEADDTPTLFIGGKHYVRIAVSEEEWRRLRKLDDKEYNSERRAVTIPEPSGNAFHRYEEEIKELAHRRRLPCSFYFEEILMRKYEFRRICKTLSYAKRIAARTRNTAQKAALRKEIAALEAERIALQRLLFRLAERYAVRYEERRES